MRPDGTPGLLVIPPAFDAERSLGWQMISWYEILLCHGPGDLQGDPLELDEEIQAFLALAYALDDDGHRLVNRAVLSRLKGRSKSEIAGAVVCGEFVGPVRFDHWAAQGETAWWGYAYEQGEPVGRPVRSPFIRCLATEESQAGNTYDNATVMLDHAASRWPEEFGRLDMGRGVQTSTRIFLAGGGEIRPSTASAASKDGGKESFAVADEHHLYVTRELRAMHNTVTRNLPKRIAAEPWFLETTTMFEPGENSVGETAYLYAHQVATGKVPNRGLLYDHREGPAVRDWDDDDELRAAIRVAAGAATWMGVDRMIGEARDPKSSRSEMERYYLNRATKGERMAIDPELWRRQARPDRGLQSGQRIGLGFDGSISDDSTALIACTADGHTVTLKVWSKPAGNKGRNWRVPRNDVHDTVWETFENYDVGLMLCDPFKWWTEVEGWAQLYGEERVLFFDTNSPKRMAPACDRWTVAVTEGGHTHDDDPTLTLHVLAMARKKVRVADDEGDGRTRYVFVKADSRKIDAGIADVLAVEAAATMPPAEQPVPPAWAAKPAPVDTRSVFRPTSRLALGGR